MSTVDALQHRYDETPYQDQAFEDLDSSRLLGMAQLFGLRSSPHRASRLRVLDLACASGLHLREQAARYPAAQFTGIDFSSHEIEIGRKEAERAGLANVELIHADLRDAEIEEGAYDLVLCHGAFSWVPDDVKDRILQLCRFGLAPDGVAAVAYLTYPGWKQKEALRELLAMRVRDIADPEERIRQSALVLRFLHASYSAFEDDPHAQSLKATVEGMQKSSANVFLHDELGRDHDPCYFMQFVEWADESGLQYLAETDLATMSTQDLPTSGAAPLEHLGPDFLETQQLLDFVVNRSGRSSMLVRNDAVFERAVTTDALTSLHVSTSWVEVTPLNARGDAPRWFESLQGQRIDVDDERVQRLMDRLLEASPASVPIGALLEAECAMGCEEDETRRIVLELISKGVADPRALLDGAS